MMRALNATSFARTLQRGRLQALADGLAIAVAVSLPWSTSATGILIVLWLIALLPTLELSAVRRELATPAGGLPVALCALAVLGLAWTDASWAERFEGLAGYVKLLTIPLLFAQFRRSERGWEALAGYLVSVLVLLTASWTLTIWPQLVWRTYPLPGIPAKDYIAQSGEFVIVAFVLLLLAGEMAKTGRRLLAALSVAITIALLANVAFVAPSRTALVVIPVLLAILGVGRAGWKMGAALILAGVVLAGIAWSSSAFLRERVLVVGTDIGQYRAGQVLTSSGLRMAFWQRSIGLVEQAPVLGHGTAAITAAFRRSAVGTDGAEAIVTANPHNQIFAVAIQLGLVGAGLLAAMWIAHLFLFRGGGLAGWIGLVVVAQNIVSSLFNSHLFDFTQGWTYAFGVGVLGGLVMRGSRSPAALAPASPS
ncbi:MAG: O-antigen ligase family protein [Rhodoplanes sp.]